ncbi:MAG: NAD(P)/FAD-dependent oxidoreductase [Myxococcota bacterium]
MTGVDLLVLGGGPAGSVAAARAAQRGLSVRLIDAATHPRRHVGESLLPGILPILEGIDALGPVIDAGFVQKTGATHLRWGIERDWDLWFRDSDEYDHAFMVNRSRFDAILFDAAVRAGAHATTETVARALLFDGDRLRGARIQRRGEALETVEARFVIDASGQAALVAQHLGGRELIEGLRHRASWAHFHRAGRLPEPRSRQALFCAEDNHWVWFFPLTEELSSVGLVELEGGPGLDYATAVRKSGIGQLLARAEQVSEVRRERDWSYRMTHTAGPGYRVVGDAAGFIDPILSTGVFMAMTSAWEAVASIEEEQRAGSAAADEYRRRHRERFEDLLRMVTFYYRQTLARDDYFWESKRILADAHALKPQKAFLILTSGLVQNLALEDRRAEAAEARIQRVEHGRPIPQDPDTLGFVCLHLRYRPEDAELFFLIEPKDIAAPTLFRTPSFDLNCIAPKFGNDPIQHPALEPALRQLHRSIEARDEEPRTAVAEFWRRHRQALAAEAAALPGDFELVRVFGE